MAGHTVTVSVLADTKKFASGMKQLSNTTGLTKLSNGLKTVAKRTAQVTAALGVAGVAAVGKFVSQAGDLEQSIGAVDTVFKGNAKQIHKWAKGAATSVGLTQNSYNELATLMGTQLKNGGTALDEIGGKTNELITLGADLSSMFGGDTKQAVEALSSALKGERDPIERYGVSLKQATIDAKAAEMGFKKVGNSLSDEGQQAATLALIMEQTADAHGNFAKESKTLQGITQRLKARFENITTTIGMKFLPIVAKAVDWVAQKLDPAMAALTDLYNSKVKPALNAATKYFKDNEEKIKDLAEKVKSGLTKALETLKNILGSVGTALRNLGTWVVKNKDWLSALAIGVGAMVASYQAYVKVMAIWKAATLVAQGVQAAFNVVLAANPIGLIVLALAGLVAGLTFFFTKTETGKKAWAAFTGALSKGWEIAKAAFKAGVKVVKTHIDNCIKFFGLILSAAKKVFSYTPIGLITTNWNKIVAFFKTFGTKIKNVFSAAKTWLVSSGKNIINGLRSGISDRWNAVKTWFRDRKTIVVNFFANAVGWLLGSGKRIISGMSDGLKDRWNAVKTWFRDRKNAIVSALPNPARILWNAGSAIISGLWNGLKSKWENVKSWVGGLGSWIANNKGPRSYDLKLLKPAGGWIMTGLQDGLKKSIPDLKRTLGAVSSTISGTKLGSPGLSSPSAAGAGGGITITINTGVGDPHAIAREIQAILSRYNRSNGGR